jgi:hypothetical protein
VAPRAPLPEEEFMGIFRSLAAAATLAALIGAGDCGAQTLYKLIDKNGKVTYSESPPKDFDGKVIRMDIDPKANTATLPSGSRFDSGAADKAAADDRVRVARGKVEAARKAFTDARDNPGEGDVARIGTKSGGARPVQTEEYRERLARLEKDLKDAEQELEKAQRAR